MKNIVCGVIVFREQLHSLFRMVLLLHMLLNDFFIHLSDVHCGCLGHLTVARAELSTVKVLGQNHILLLSLDRDMLGQALSDLNLFDDRGRVLYV